MDLHQSNLLIVFHSTWVQINGTALVHCLGGELTEGTVDAQEILLILMERLGEVIDDVLVGVLGAEKHYGQADGQNILILSLITSGLDGVSRETIFLLKGGHNIFFDYSVMSSLMRQ